MSIKALIMWPIEHLRVFAMAAVICLLSVMINAVWSPSIDPISPAELARMGVEESMPLPRTAQASLDFIFRPLFRPSRKPPAQTVSTPTVEVHQTTEVASVKILSGYSLLGVFASGETSGAIVSTTEGQRQRVYVGDQLDGWRLQKTSLRAAYFENAAGVEAAIELAVASSLPELPTVAPARPKVTPAATSAGGERSDSGKNDVAETAKRPMRPSGPVTFESIAARKRAEQEAARKKSEQK